MENKILYLDYAASAPMLEEVKESLIKHMGFFANPSSQHALGRKVKHKIEETRMAIGDYLHLPYRALHFCSGATEANNSLLFSTARRLARESGNRHIITSQIEHPSVLRVMQTLEKEGFDLTYLPVDTNGNISLDTLAKALRDDTILVSIMAVNNETGAIQDIPSMGRLLEEKGIFFHSDMVQALGKAVFDYGSFPIDAMSFSAHKIAGPKGLGFFYHRLDVPLEAWLIGGSQESDTRAGTENSLGIIACKEAIRYLQENEKQNKEKYQALREYFFDELEKREILCKRNGQHALALDNIISLYLPGKLATSVLIQMDLQGIMLSAGSACSAGSVKRSHVLEAMYPDQDRVKESVRISFGPETTREDLDRLLDAIERLR